MDIPTLKTLLEYNRESGELIWLPRKPELFNPKRQSKEHAANCWNRQRAGKAAGTVSGDGHLQLRIFNKRYLAHRVGYAIHHERWPTGIVDHINGDPSDNRICNLRDATRSQNGANFQRTKRGHSRFIGVTYCKNSGVWKATAQKNGVRYNLGSFQSEKDAALAYDKKAREVHGEFATTNF